MFSTLVFLCTSVLMHPVHETVSEVEWNAQTHALEVSLRMSVLDEQWMVRQYAAAAAKVQQSKPESPKSQEAKPHTTSQSQRLQQTALLYLRSNFRLDPSADRTQKNTSSAKYQWVGRQEEGSHVWWFFQIEPADKQQPTDLHQTMFFERGQGYANRILILGQVPKRAATLTIRRPNVNIRHDAKARLPQAGSDAAPNSNAESDAQPQPAQPQPAQPQPVSATDS